MPSKIEFPEPLNKLWCLSFWVFGSDQLPFFFNSVLRSGEEKIPRCLNKNLPLAWWYQLAWDLGVALESKSINNGILVWNGLSPELAEALSSLDWRERWLLSWKTILEQEPHLMRDYTYWSESLLNQCQKSLDTKVLALSPEIRIQIKNLKNSPLVPSAQEVLSKDTLKTLRGEPGLRLVFPPKQHPVLLGIWTGIALFCFFFPVLWLSGLLPLSSPFSSTVSVPTQQTGLKLVELHWLPTTEYALQSLASTLPEMREDSSVLPSVLPWYIKIKPGYYPLLLQVLQENGTFLSPPPNLPALRSIHIHLHQ